MKCEGYKGGTTCLLEYFSFARGTIDTLSIDMRDLEKTSEQEFIRLLIEQQES